VELGDLMGEWEFMGILDGTWRNHHLSYSAATTSVTLGSTKPGFVSGKK